MRVAGAFPTPDTQAGAMGAGGGGHTMRSHDRLWSAGAATSPSTPPGSSTSIVGFTLWVTGVSVTLSLAITVVGLLSALAFFWAFRWFARIERHRAALVLGAPIPERYRRGDPGASWFARLRAAAADPATWKDFAWTGICGVLGFALVGRRRLAVGLDPLPRHAADLVLGAEPAAVDRDHGLRHAAEGARSRPAPASLLFPVCGLIVRGLTRLELAAMVPLLRPPRGEELAERVDVLTTTRAGAVDAQAAELQRIERDLHDGAQARLVALAMSLGMAEEKLDSDPRRRASCWRRRAARRERR